MSEIKIFQSDCLSVLPSLGAESVDLVFTSPPYAERRKKTYGGISADRYVEWFLSISAELYRVLKPDGSFVLNIKEHVENGERHTYVIELILALKKQGWLWTEEYIWHKKNSYPGRWPNRFRDSWERLLQFNKTRKFKMYQEAVMVEIGERTKARMKRLNANDFVRHPSATGSGFGVKMVRWLDKKLVYPTNVLHLATESKNRGHSAAFPEALPDWFIRLFTQPGDWVLDPFVGSGTTCAAAARLGRNAIGIEILPEHIRLAEERLSRISDAKIELLKGEIKEQKVGDAVEEHQEPVRA